MPYYQQQQQPMEAFQYTASYIASYKTKLVYLYLTDSLPYSWAEHFQNYILRSKIYFLAIFIESYMVLVAIKV